jgi:PEP-CTERM motif
MKSTRWISSVLFCVAILWGATDQARASMTLGTGLGTTHAGNLVANGSFETGAPAFGIANTLYWATGTALTPFAVPAGWTSSGSSSSYAFWGSDTIPQTINGSDTFPDGNAALYFGNGAPVFVNQPPTFHPNGTVSFPSPPSFINNFSPVPVVLSQSINTPANPAAAYHFSFWVSGEGAVSGQNFNERGIFGLQVTNVLSGDPIQWLTVPNGSGNGFGVSHLYEFTFTPLVPSAPVTINFINWGHFDLSSYGMSNFTTELIMDDAIINGVPEPATSTLLATAGLAAIGFHFRRRKAARLG